MKGCKVTDVWNTMLMHGVKVIGDKDCTRFSKSLLDKPKSTTHVCIVELSIYLRSQYAQLYITFCIHLIVLILC